MKEKIKSVTLKVSQEGASYLQNGIYAKYFMDIMSNLHVSFKYDKETYEPELIYGPTAFFNLFELAAPWNMFPEQVVAVVLELRENGLLSFTLTDEDFVFEPEIATFVSDDDLTFRGSASGVDALDYDFDNIEEVDKVQIISYLASLTTVVFSAEQLAACSLAVNAKD
ncbi:MAG: hypothetical protein MR689_09730 [Bacteroidales bacterium]|nr:hypothetical protein [Bacteroidales bacterium]